MHTWSRRQALALGLAAGACATGEAERAALPAGESLHALAAAKGMRFGSAVGTRTHADPAYRAILAHECGVLVSENEHKWPYLEPRPGAWTPARADALTAWADEQGLAYRGHCLVWHHPRWLPRWVMEHDYGAAPRAEAERLIVTHINQTCAHDGGRIKSWDVVNETVHEGTGEFRDTPLGRCIGPEVIDLCFHTARAAAPHAELVYNDYMNWQPGSANHRNGVLRHLEQWLGRGVPIDALGVQGHIGTTSHDAGAWTARDEVAWRAFMDDVTGMGLRILITELDVNDNPLPADIAARDAEVAAHARAYLDLMLSYPQTRDVLAWGMVDKYSWLNGFSPREDGAPKRCTPYDAHFQAKPLREAIAASFRAAPARPAAETPA